MVQKIKCPKCKTFAEINTSDRYIPDKHIKLKSVHKIKCYNCHCKFKLKEGAFVDGIFLDERKGNNPYKQRSKEYLKQICIELDIERIESIVWKLLLHYDEITDKAIFGRRVIVASMIYIVNRIYNHIPHPNYNNTILINGKEIPRKIDYIPKVQKEVCDVANCTEMTLRRNYYKIVKNFGLEVEDYEDMMDKMIKYYDIHFTDDQP